MTDQWLYLDVNWYVKIKDEISAFKNMNAGTLNRGKAVKLSSYGIDLFTSLDSESDFFGILMQDVDSGKAADVKYKGYLPIKYFTGSLTIVEGTPISVDATGSFVENSTFTILKATDNSNVLIKE